MGSQSQGRGEGCSSKSAAGDADALHGPGGSLGAKPHVLAALERLGAGERLVSDDQELTQGISEGGHRP